MPDNAGKKEYNKQEEADGIDKTSQQPEMGGFPELIGTIILIPALEGNIIQSKFGRPVFQFRDPYINVTNLQKKKEGDLELTLFGLKQSNEFTDCMLMLSFLIYGFKHSMQILYTRVQH